MAYQIAPVKGKNAALAARIAQANTFPTLAEKLAACGLGAYVPFADGSGGLDNQAVNYVLEDLADQGLIANDDAAGVRMGLYGLPDMSSVPSSAWAYVAGLSVVLAPPVALAALVQVLRSTSPTIQAVVVTKRSLADMLGAVATVDPAAADMLANQIAANQSEYGSEYLQRLVGAFQEGAWYGAVQAVKVPVQAAAKALGLAVGAIVEGVSEGLGLWGWLAVLAGGGYLAHRAGLLKKLAR